jgi:serine acetyltransferase
VVWTKATVAGPINVGDWARIGAHTLVMRDVAADQFVAAITSNLGEMSDL